MTEVTANTFYRLDVGEFELLFLALRECGFHIVGPRLRDQAIVYEELRSSADLPIGWVDQQEKGVYRLSQSASPTYFGYNLGPDSWKKFLYPKGQLLWEAQQQDGTLQLRAPKPLNQKFAFLGVRACEAAALTIQSRVREVSGQPSPADAGNQPLLVGVNCAQAAATCFCASMNTGPGFSTNAYDIVLTEFYSEDDHHFLLSAGSSRGLQIAEKLPLESVDDNAPARIAAQVAATAASMHRTLRIEDPAAFFNRNLESPQWDKVAERCLSCANCTLVCPTCFCTTVEDSTDLTGEIASRWLRWDSCFNLDFTHIHGGSIRKSTRSRYRQWLTHKLGTWFDQFGSSGCVGCGRCIAWCPVGIDLTEEAVALRSLEKGTTP